MILDFLNEKLNLKEEINLDNPTIRTVYHNIYELENYNDFNAFTLADNNNVSSHFNFTQNNWETYVNSGRVKPFVITNTNSNQCIAMMLLWSDNNYNFKIREGKVVSLPISFESASNSGDSAYSNFHEGNNPLPIYAMLDRYRDFTHFDPDTYIADGQFIKNGALIGIFTEFFKLDGTDFVYPQNINLNQLELTKLNASSINYQDIVPNEQHAIHINFYDNLTQIASNAIDADIPGDLLYYCGDEDELPSVFNSLPEAVRDNISFPNNEEVQQRRQNARNRQIVQGFEDDVEELYNRLTADDYQYDDENDGYLADLFTDYEALTDEQKQMVTCRDNLEIMRRIQSEAKQEYLSELSQQFMHSFIEDLWNVVMADNYSYNGAIDKKINYYDSQYNDFDDDLKSLLNTEFNFTDKFNQIKEKQSQLKQQWEATRAQRIADLGTIVYDNTLIAKINGGEAIITGYIRSNVSHDVVYIPDRIEGVKVRKIAKNAFANYGRISNLVLPKFLKNIESYAFYGCDIRNVYLNIEDREAQDKYTQSVQCAANAFPHKPNVGITNVNRYYTLKQILDAAYYEYNVRIGAPNRN